MPLPFLTIPYRKHFPPCPCRGKWPGPLPCLHPLRSQFGGSSVPTPPHLQCKLRRWVTSASSIPHYEMGLLFTLRWNFFVTPFFQSFSFHWILFISLEAPWLVKLCFAWPSYNPSISSFKSTLHYYNSFYLRLPPPWAESLRGALPPGDMHSAIPYWALCSWVKKYAEGWGIMSVSEGDNSTHKWWKHKIV